MAQDEQHLSTVNGQSHLDGEDSQDTREPDDADDEAESQPAGSNYVISTEPEQKKKKKKSGSKAKYKKGLVSYLSSKSFCILTLY